MIGAVSFKSEGAPEPDRPLGSPGETGVSGACGTVYGVDGLIIGGGGGGAGFTNCPCACACPSAKHAIIKVTHPAMTSFADAGRCNRFAIIQVSVSSVCRCQPPSILERPRIEAVGTRYRCACLSASATLRHQEKAPDAILRGFQTGKRGLGGGGIPVQGNKRAGLPLVPRVRQGHSRPNPDDASRNPGDVFSLRRRFRHPARIDRGPHPARRCRHVDVIDAERL
jgi:hypothetical protein